jgi:hypothetical protein
MTSSESLVSLVFSHESAKSHMRCNPWGFSQRNQRRERERDSFILTSFQFHCMVCAEHNDSYCHILGWTTKVLCLRERNSHTFPVMEEGNTPDQTMKYHQTNNLATQGTIKLIIQLDTKKLLMYQKCAWLSTERESHVLCFVSMKDSRRDSHK